MSQVPPNSDYSLTQILEIIAKLRRQLEDDPNLSETQRAALQALLSYYLAISEQLEKHVDSIMSAD
jgi:hypothetical protein